MGNLLKDKRIDNILTAQKRFLLGLQVGETPDAIAGATRCLSWPDSR
jgi:hypothetical protein